MVGLASGVAVGGGSDGDVAGTEADCVGPGAADAGGAVTPADVDRAAGVGSVVADSRSLGLELALLPGGREAPADSRVLGGTGAEAGNVVVAVRPWLLMLARPADDAVGPGVGTSRTAGPAVRAGRSAGWCDRPTAPIASRLIPVIAAASAVRKIHRVRRKPDFFVEIGRSGFDDGGSTHAVSSPISPRTTSSGPTKIGLVCPARIACSALATSVASGRALGSCAVMAVSSGTQSGPS